MTIATIANATHETRVTRFTYQRNLSDDGGTINYAISEFVAEDGVPIPGMLRERVGMAEAGAAEASQCPGVAVPALGLPALVDPVTGADLSQVSNAGMVLIVERICLALAAAQAQAST